MVPKPRDREGGRTVAGLARPSGLAKDEAMVAGSAVTALFTSIQALGWVKGATA